MPADITTETMTKPVRIMGAEPVSSRRPPVSDRVVRVVWPERGEDGIVRVYVGHAGGAKQLLELGVAGEDAEWLASWLEGLALAVRSVDR